MESNKYANSSYEQWMNSCTVYFGIPPIQKHLPIDLIYEIFQDEHIKFHLEGSLDCY